MIPSQNPNEEVAMVTWRLLAITLVVLAAAHPAYTDDVGSVGATNSYIGQNAGLVATYSTRPGNFVMVGDGTLDQPILSINADGSVYYRGRLLGTDQEIYEGLRAAFDPWHTCQELEERLPWRGGKP